MSEQLKNHNWNPMNAWGDWLVQNASRRVAKMSKSKSDISVDKFEVLLDANTFHWG